MTLTRKKFVIGTRKSKLALWQTHCVAGMLTKAWPGIEIDIKHIVTVGDRTQALDKPLPEIGGKGLFTAELEEALLDRSIDMAVHSLKDLPTSMDKAFVLGATPERASVWDVLISKDGRGIRDLPQGACVGTSSIRRSSQIKRVRPDIVTESIRGNVDTRIAKLTDPKYRYDAIVLARAGLERLERDSEITEVFNEDLMLPAPGQGAMAVQVRADDDGIASLLKAIHHDPTFYAVTAERAFLGSLGAGCNTPVAALAVVSDGRVSFTGRCLSPDGTKCVEVSGEGAAADAARLGAQMAERALEQGAREILLLSEGK